MIGFYETQLRMDLILCESIQKEKGANIDVENDPFYHGMTYLEIEEKL